jgi:hypothetical protein
MLKIAVIQGPDLGWSVSVALAGGGLLMEGTTGLIGVSLTEGAVESRQPDASVVIISSKRPAGVFL